MTLCFTQLKVNCVEYTDCTMGRLVFLKIIVLCICIYLLYLNFCRTTGSIFISIKESYIYTLNFWIYNIYRTFVVHRPPRQKTRAWTVLVWPKYENRTRLSAKRTSNNENKKKSPRHGHISHGGSPLSSMPSWNGTVYGGEFNLYFYRFRIKILSNVQLIMKF